MNFAITVILKLIQLQLVEKRKYNLCINSEFAFLKLDVVVRWYPTQILVEGREVIFLQKYFSENN